MSDELRLAGAALLSAAVTAAATPAVIRIALRTSFLDHPHGYKHHIRSTPYLGGVAVFAGFLAAFLVFGESVGRLWPIVALAAGLALLGTIDDRISLGFTIRVVVVIAAAFGLYRAGLGWEYLSSEPANLLLTILFVLGVVNAFNLMDNLDGATGTVGLVSAVGVAALAWIEGDTALAVMCLGLAGACSGFLPYNLAAPSRIFLGDGGSMPIGFVIAASLMALEGGAQIGWEMVLVMLVLVGLPALDTALVIVSRSRRGADVFSGSRDHLTHRLLLPMGSPRRVALVLAGGQAVLCTIGIALYGGDKTAAVAGAVTCVLAGMGLIALLESPRWAPALQEDSLYSGTPEDVGVSPFEGELTPATGAGLETAFTQTEMDPAVGSEQRRRITYRAAARELPD